MKGAFLEVRRMSTREALLMDSPLAPGLLRKGKEGRKKEEHTVGPELVIYSLARLPLRCFSTEAQPGLDIMQEILAPPSTLLFISYCTLLFLSYLFAVPGGGTWSLPHLGKHSTTELHHPS